MKKLSTNNNLTAYPEIAEEWHPTKNGKLTPCDVYHGSGKKYWWKCQRGHEWIASANGRLLKKKKRKCPYCTNMRVCEENSLEFLYSEIATEWHPNKNGSLNPNNVVFGSGERVWWRCQKGHEWEMKIIYRTRAGRGCPHCFLKNKCLTTLYPEIAEEWHPIKNGTLTPNDIFSKTNKKYWWKCQKGHEWITSPNKRAGRNDGCPVCSKSLGEKQVDAILYSLNVKFKRQWKFKSCKNIFSLPFDFIIKTKSGIKAIEYQGKQHYAPVKDFGGEKEFIKLQKRDLIKQNWCEEKGVPLLKIPYWEFKNIEMLLKEFIT